MSEILRGSPDRVLKVLFEERRRMPEVEALIEARGITSQTHPRDVLEALVGEGLVRGVVAVARPPRIWDMHDLLAATPQRAMASGRRLLVALDGVQDPRNLGAIVRSAEFFGAMGVLQTRDRAAPLTPLAVRASAGGTERLPLAKVTNLRRALDACKEGGFWVVGTVVDGGRPLGELSGDALPDNLVLVLGSEQRGLRPLVREGCDFLATIEGAGDLGSLNVASAAAAAMALLGQARPASSRG